MYNKMKVAKQEEEKSNQRAETQEDLADHHLDVLGAGYY
jgi:hypothetical protein